MFHCLWDYGAYIYGGVHAFELGKVNLWDGLLVLTFITDPLLYFLHCFFLRCVDMFVLDFRKRKWLENQARGGTKKCPIIRLVLQNQQSILMFM